MTYKRKVTQSYTVPRRSPKTLLRDITLRSKVATANAPRTQKTTTSISRGFYANIMGLTRFLARYLSGKGNVMVTADSSPNAGYSVGKEEVKGRPFYRINVPNWQTYDLPLQQFDKYRIYRNGVWHESAHIRYTPDEVYYYGVRGTNQIADPLKHDVINIIEDRRIEDLGVKEWRGYTPERLFSNAYAWSQRMSVGDFWKVYLKQYFDPDTGNYTSSEDDVLRRISHMRHEAILQRLLVGKIKDADKLPVQELKKIEDAAEYVEKKLEKQNSDDPRKVFETLRDLTEKVIRDLELEHWQPDITRLGESSWDQTFRHKQSTEADRQRTRAGIDDYFDEMMTVEVVCEKCGKHYTKRYGLRGEEGRKFREAVKAMGEEDEEKKHENVGEVEKE